MVKFLINKFYFLFSKKIGYVLMIMLALFINVKYIFIDFGIDAEFQISMSYRLATGDVMFKEMWEPYQMSTFLCATFIKIWLWLFDSTTGIVLFLQIMGSVIDGLIAYFLYRTVYKYFDDKKTAFIMAWVFSLISPKDVPLPEYANMQIWFGMLLGISFFVYYKEHKKRYLFLSAIFLCAMILSYPSCLIVFLGIIGLLIALKRKDGILIFTGTCFVIGMVYLGFIFSNVSINEFLITIENMLAIETSHAISMTDKMLAYLKDIIELAVIIGGAYIVPGTVIWLANRKKVDKDKEYNRLLTNIFFFLIVTGISLYTIIFFESDWRFYYSIIFICIIVIGIQYVRKLSKDQKIFYWICMVISCLEFVATILLTNLEIIVSVPYLLIATIASFLPISEELRQTDINRILNNLKYFAVVSLIVLLAFRSVYIIRPMWKHINTIFEIEGIVKSGPAIGIMSTYMGPYIQNETIKEWGQYIEDGDTIYMIGGSLDTLGYLYADTNIGAPSLVPTPGYNENILEYWEMNPQKYPDVIIASCWYGTMDVELPEDSWIIKWINEEYQPEKIIDGKYWRYYINRQ